MVPLLRPEECPQCDLSDYPDGQRRRETDPDHQPLDRGGQATQLGSEALTGLQYEAHTMKHSPSRRVAGFTLIELMVTITVAAVQVSIPEPAYTSQNRLSCC